MGLFRGPEDVVRVGGRGAAGLGAGAFASVSLVHHRAAPGVLYAMKEVQKRTPALAELIGREIRLHRSLAHPHVIAFVDHFETKDRFFLFLEYAQNGDLFEHLRRARPREEECLRLFHQTCEGIRYIHANNVMHRDLKPENILLDAQLNVKIADFGWSALYSPEEDRQTLCGTMEYMAPEVFLRRKQTKKTDVWALGVLLYELFHGHAPFRASTPDGLLRQIAQNSLPFRRDIDPRVRDLTLRILSFEPAKRPSAEEIIAHEAVQAFLARSSRARPAEPEQRAAPTLRAKPPPTAPKPQSAAPCLPRTAARKENAPVALPAPLSQRSGRDGAVPPPASGEPRKVFAPVKLSANARPAPPAPPLGGLRSAPHIPAKPQNPNPPQPQSFANYLFPRTAAAGRPPSSFGPRVIS